jgi:hypothetical protein
MEQDGFSSRGVLLIFFRNCVVAAAMSRDTVSANKSIGIWSHDSVTYEVGCVKQHTM